MKKRSALRSLLLTSMLLGVCAALIAREYHRAQTGHALILAIKANETTEAQYALAAGADPNVREESGKTPSLKSSLLALWNRFRGVPPPGSGQSALALAVERNNTLLVEALLVRGARKSSDTLKVTYTRRTEVSAPLVMAAHNENVAIVQALARHGWDVNAHAEDGSTALFAAGDAATIRALIACGANINGTTKNGLTALDVALFNQGDEAAAALVDLGAYDTSALRSAVIDGDTRTLQAMIRQGWNLDAPNANLGRSDDTPLMESLQVDYSRSAETILLLIQNEPDVNRPDNGGHTPLMYLASCEGAYDLLQSYPKLLEALIARGARVNAQDDSGMTALMCAANCKNAVLIRQLLKHGARVNMRTKDGETALSCALEDGALVRGDKAEAIRVLKAAGALP